MRIRGRESTRGELARLARNLGDTTTPRRRFGMVRVPMCEDSLTNWVVEGTESLLSGEADPCCVRIRSQTGRLRCGEALVSGDRPRHMRIDSQTGAPRSFPPIGPPHLPSDNNAEGLFARVDSCAKSPSNSAIGRKRDYPNWRTIPALLHDCTSTPSARLHLTLTTSPVPAPCHTPAQSQAHTRRQPPRR